MRRLALVLHQLARYIDPTTCIDITQDVHDGIRTVRIEGDGNRVICNLPASTRHAKP